MAIIHHHTGWLTASLIALIYVYLILSMRKHGRTVLLPRTGCDWTERFADVAFAIRQTPARTLILDGEVTVLDAKLISRTELLQDGGRPLMFIVFDCLRHLRRARPCRCPSA